MSGRHTSLTLATPRTTRPAGRYVSLWFGALAGPPITLAPSALPTGKRGVLYTLTTITASGAAGPYAFDVVSGTFPPGLALDPAGAVSGTPTSANTYTFTVRATDSTPPGLGGPYAGTRTYTVTINEPPFRGLFSSVGAAWTMQAVLTQPTGVAWDTSRAHHSQLAAAWKRSAIVDRILASRWGQVPAKHAAAALPWDRQAARHRAVGAGWSDLVPLDASTALPWEMPPPLAASLAADWTAPPPVDPTAPPQPPGPPMGAPPGLDPMAAGMPPGM